MFPRTDLSFFVEKTEIAGLAQVIRLAETLHFVTIGFIGQAVPARVVPPAVAPGTVTGALVLSRVVTRFRFVQTERVFRQRGRSY